MSSSRRMRKLVGVLETRRDIGVEEYRRSLSEPVRALADLSAQELEKARHLRIVSDEEELRQRVRHMSNLVSLDVQMQDANHVPSEIYDLVHLRQLVIARNVASLPPGISRLPNLKGLWLGGNALTALPPDIVALRGLEDLRIGVNQLTAIPREVFELTGLQTLVVHGNELTELPPEIGQLTGLIALYANGNELMALPPEIGQLTRLTALVLSSNQLTELPAEIGRLTELNDLRLDNNRLTALPPEIGRLTQLATLHLSGNELTSLPAEFTRLEQLSVLDAQANPFDDPLPELLERGPDAVLSYLRGLEQDGVPLYEAKVLLVGEGEVGKTSLAEALQGHAFQEGRPTTHGIELASLRLPHPSEDVDVTLNLWDFGGQEVYRITHQFFFSRRAVYLLVWKPRQGRSENAIEEWLQLIRLRVGLEARVVIVATHGDERRPELDVPYLQRKFGSMIVGQHVVDNKSGNGIGELATAIAAQTVRLPQIGSLMSRRWIAVRDELATMVEPQIVYDRYEETCRRHAVDDEAMKTLAELLHDLGHVVYFGDDEGLRDVIVLQPEWLTKAIGYVLEDGSTRAAGGELDHRRLIEIWCDPTRESYPRKYHPYFLRLMEKFDVSYRIPDHDKSLVSQLVPYERPALQWETGTNGIHELSLVCALNDEATGLMPWLTVRTYRFSTGTHWRRGLLLDYEEYKSRALLELHGSSELHLTVRAPAPMYLFSILRDTVEELIRHRWPGLDYDIFVPCPGAAAHDTRCSGRMKLWTLERLLAKEQSKVLCQECIEEHDVLSLLTGFSVGTSDLNALLVRQTSQLDHIEHAMARVESGVDDLQATAADAAMEIRIVRKALAAEVIDCPRLISVEAVDPAALNPTKLWKATYRMSLWCEHPGYEHRCEHPGYEFTEPHEWFVRTAPFLRTMSKLLRLLPVAGAAAGLLSVDQDQRHSFEMKRLKGEIDLMDSIASRVTASIDTSTTFGEEALVVDADPVGLRAVRALLFKLDPQKQFAGLRRVQTMSGDFLWVCPEHYGFYDPGLPEIPTDPPTGPDRSEPR